MSKKKEEKKGSKFSEKNKGKGSGSNINYKAEDGWHEARIVALCDCGEEVKVFKGVEKIQEKVSVMFLLDENATLENGKVLAKTKVEKYTFSLNEKSRIVTSILEPAGIKIESFDELLGKTLKLKLKTEIEEQ